MALSLKEFATQKNQTDSGTSSSDGSLSSFAAQRGGSGGKSSSLSSFAREKETDRGFFSSVGKQLMKPVGVAAKEFRGVGEALGHVISAASPKVTLSEGLGAAGESLVEAQKGAARVITGKEESSFSREFSSASQEAGLDETKLDKAFGIGSDFVLDPLNFIPVTKVAKFLGRATKLDVPAAKLAGAVRNAPVVKKAAAVFSTKTGNQAFDATVTKFRSLYSYREGALIEDARGLQKALHSLKKGGIKNIDKIVTEGLENPAARNAITDPNVKKIVTSLQITYKDLLKQSRAVGLKVGEIAEYAPHIRTKASLLGALKKEVGLGAREFGKGAIEKGRKLDGSIAELSKQGIKIFEQNPAVQLVKKGQTFAKAITSQEFATAVKNFAIKDGVEVSHPALKGMKFLPEQARVIDNYYTRIKPEEIKAILGVFDKVQNWWKGQALISPAYHIRNVAGNVWNNFLANVNPAYYVKAGHLQKNILKNPEIIEEMKKLGVINEGWYAKDIGEEVVNSVRNAKSVKAGLNPLSQQNYLFKLNKAGGSVVENNARIAHYLSKKAEGLSSEAAAESVKKFLFDYSDLTNIEKTVFKRVFPFYTWTRKNIPVQLEGLVTQPAKYALPHKIISEIESGVKQPDEKYMGEYISENVPVRIRKNKDNNTEYFLLGNWLPYAQALDVLSHPIENTVAMLSPVGKTPYELGSNKSTFFKDTLGEPASIERFYKEQGEFLGMSMRKKNILLLRNIRMLNDMNKWIDKRDPTATKDSWPVKVLNTLFGKTATYDVGKSKYFFNLDTSKRVSELKQSIKGAQKKRDRSKVTELQKELREFLKSRN